ncbi:MULTISPECIES: hypothetical protein [unclassified Yoonia]|uniref:hypothetical protein n=1 Tax=unclassified Yoonia TaxID=2629118 RepID=UPI002AFFF0D2|nr:MULTISPECIES: hypothetical protein [unclassified Yoonia]
MNNDAETQDSTAGQETSEPSRSSNVPEPQRDRWKLRSDVEDRFKGYEILHQRLLQGAAGLGIAGVLGERSLTAINTAENFEVSLAGIALLLAALVMAVLTTPLFLSAFAAFIGPRRFHREPRQDNAARFMAKPDWWGITFAVLSVLMFVALVTILSHTIAES